METNNTAETCRNWKLNPIGCLKGPDECEFVHRETGLVSPATITCWQWKNGGCKMHDDSCIFAHHETGKVQASAFATRSKCTRAPLFLSRLGRQSDESRVDRPMHHKERAIAKAAAVAGFDCSDVDRVMALVNAVRDAEAGSRYPDYWRGQSTNYGARLPRGNGRLRSYEDVDNPAVPTFTFSSDQILSSMRSFGPGDNFMSYMGQHVVETRDQQTVNLHNKRTPGSRFWPSQTKKQKTSSTQTTTTATQQLVVDLTLDEGDIGSQAGPYTHPSRRGLVPGTSPRTASAAPATRNARNRERNTKLQTEAALNRISNTLSSQLDQLARARETLKSRWDEDSQLQLQAVTDGR